MTDNNAEYLSSLSNERSAVRLQRILSGGLVAALGRTEYKLLGMSIKTRNGDCLITLRLDTPDGRMVSYVGGYDMAEAFQKAFREAQSARLRLKPDRYARK